MSKLVLSRHGEFLRNRENRSRGWTDNGLTEKGSAVARTAGRSRR